MCSVRQWTYILPGLGAVIWLLWILALKSLACWSGYSLHRLRRKKISFASIHLWCMFWKLALSFLRRRMFSMAAKFMHLMTFKALVWAHGFPWRRFSACPFLSVLAVLSPLHTAFLPAVVRWVVCFSKIAMAASHFSASCPVLVSFASWVRVGSIGLTSFDDDGLGDVSQGLHPSASGSMPFRVSVASGLQICCSALRNCSSLVFLWPGLGSHHMCLECQRTPPISRGSPQVCAPHPWMFLRLPCLILTLSLRITMTS